MYTSAFLKSVMFFPMFSLYKKHARKKQVATSPSSSQDSESESRLLLPQRWSWLSFLLGVGIGSKSVRSFHFFYVGFKFFAAPAAWNLFVEHTLAVISLQNCWGTWTPQNGLVCNGVQILQNLMPHTNQLLCKWRCCHMIPWHFFVGIAWWKNALMGEYRTFGFGMVFLEWAV